MSPGRRQPRGPTDWAAIRARMERAEAAVEEALYPSPARAKAIMDARAQALSQAPASAPSPGAHLEVVEFSLGQEQYAIEARFVREVVRFADYTPVPGTPEFIVGVTNLRGILLTVIDLRRLFNIATMGLTDQSRVIVLGTERVEFGVLADTAHGHTGHATDDILTPPGDVSGIGRSYLRGVTRDAVIVLDGARLIDDERLFIQRARQSAQLPARKENVP